MVRIISTLVKLFRQFIKEEGERLKMNKVEVNAVFGEDIIPFLKSIEMYYPIVNGEVLCAECASQVTLQNFLSVYVDNGEIKVCCDDLRCYNSMIEKGAFE